MSKLDPTHPAFLGCFVELRGVCSTREVLPKLSMISDDLLSTDDVPFAFGGLADMHKGSLSKLEVCVEKVRTYLNGGPRKVKKVYNPSRPFSSFYLLRVLSPFVLQTFYLEAVT